MNDIAELERRITAALDRIGQGLDRLPPAATGREDADAAAQTHELASELARLREELDAERDANAQLTERLRAVKDRDTQTVRDLEQRIETMTRQLDVQGLELQRMRKTTIQLRENLRALREARTTGQVEPYLLNKAMLTELEALRATRAAEIAEMDEILAEMAPLLREVSEDA